MGGSIAYKWLLNFLVWQLFVDIDFIFPEGILLSNEDLFSKYQKKAIFVLKKVCVVKIYPIIRTMPHLAAFYLLTLFKADLGTSIDLKSVDQVTTNKTWLF